MQNQKRNSKNKGITLMALILTIVVLVILATITMQEVSGDGIFSKAKESARKTELAKMQEEIELAKLESQIGIGTSSVQSIIDKYTESAYYENGEEYIKTKDGNKINVSEITTATNYTDGNYSYVKAVNSPKLAKGMKAVYWDEENKEIVQGDANFNIQNWYNYEDTTNNANSSKWANAVIEVDENNKSYFVWIPRYEYKITYYTNSSKTTESATKTNYGTIDVNFIPTLQTTASQGYIIHPAFQDGSKKEISYGNGEWNAEISGIWVAKYEMSRADATITSAGSSTTFKSMPSVISARSISIGNMYTYSQKYNNNLGLEDNLNSHLMKNSEWGAVAYLTHSKYGRNGAEININACSNFITGAGSTSPNAGKYDYNSSTFESTYSYTSNYGKLASSTGNIYGIYDLSGGAWEYTAGYITNGNGSLGNGSSFIDADRKIANAEGYKDLSTKYATVYPYNSSSDSSANNYTAYRNLRTNHYGYGDALAETAGWNGDYAGFANSSAPFFRRGGSCNDGACAGVFCSGGIVSGGAYGYVGFRAVLVVE